jgi:hypothetical protein
MATAMLKSRGFELGQSGGLRESNDVLHDAEAMRARMVDDGCLFFRGLLDREEVLDARRFIMEKLAERGDLDPNYPPMDGVPAPGKELHFEPKLADKSNLPLQKLLYAPNGAMIKTFERFLGGPVGHFDYTWLRCVSPGLGTASHCDVVYMGRGTKNLYTAWTPLGDIDTKMGGLMVLEDSHKNERLRETYGKYDVDEYCVNRPAKKKLNGWLSQNPMQISKSLGGRWLTAEFRAGDVVIFTVYLVHGGLDNQSDRIRLSSDSRYQLASEPTDERWVGDDPAAHGDAGKRGRIC